MSERPFPLYRSWSQPAGTKVRTLRLMADTQDSKSFETKSLEEIARSNRLDWRKRYGRDWYSVLVEGQAQAATVSSRGRERTRRGLSLSQPADFAPPKTEETENQLLRSIC